jgi:hypothetical protein
VRVCACVRACACACVRACACTHPLNQSTDRSIRPPGLRTVNTLVAVCVCVCVRAYCDNLRPMVSHSAAAHRNTVRFHESRRPHVVVQFDTKQVVYPSQYTRAVTSKGPACACACVCVCVIFECLYRICAAQSSQPVSLSGNLPHK